MTKKEAIIIGAGISGATLARLLAEENWNVSVYEKRRYVGGNCFDKRAANGVLYHRFGPHIFHTINNEVASFVQRFAKFNGYINRVAVYLPNNQKSRLPFNFKQIRIFDPKNAEKIIGFLKNKFPHEHKISITTLHELSRELPCLAKLADWLYANIYAPYTAKMWGVPINKIDPAVISRVGITLSDDESYFPGAILQGLPVGGYTLFIEKILKHKNIKLFLNSDGLKNLELQSGKTKWKNQNVNCPIIYCGPIEKLLNNKYGLLPYRSLEFRFVTRNIEKAQEWPIINYPLDKKRTRTVEYKQLTKEKSNKTILSTEYPGAYNPENKKWNIPYYPINNDENAKIYQEYRSELNQYKNLHLLGRLAEYRYLDMDAAIWSAMNLFKKIRD